LPADYLVVAGRIMSDVPIEDDFDSSDSFGTTNERKTTSTGRVTNLLNDDDFSDLSQRK